MNHFTGKPFVRILPAFCLGIYSAFSHLSNEISVATIFIVSFIVILIFSKKRFVNYKHRHIRGVFINLMFFSLGYFLTHYKDQRESNKYFLNVDSVAVYQGKILDSRVNRNGNIRLVSEITNVKVATGWKSVVGKCYVYLPNDSQNVFVTGDEIIFQGKPSEILPPPNPGQFDFKYYANVNGISVQFRLKAGEWKISSGKDFSIKRFAEQLRDHFLDSYKKAGLSGQEYAVLSALVLGYDEEIDSQTMQAFSASGTLHVLSVSGMHVGIIFSALSAILFFMERKKSLRILRLIILIVSLWFYALLTGFSPSVIRSAMMFSFILLGKFINRNASIYNSLALSAFCIFIFIDPLYLFQVGLQLSYVAVWGIAFIYPHIFNSFFFANTFIQKIWSLVAVSIAAQFATFAISVYYFHQFPVYFIFANLVIIPLSTIGIFSGILLLFLQPFAWLSAFAGKIIQFLIHILNESALLFVKLPFALWSNISISLIEATIIYLFIFAFIYWLSTKSIKNLFACLSLLNLFFISLVIHSYFQFRQDSILFFSGTKNICCQLTRGFETCLFYFPVDSERAINCSNYYCSISGLPQGRRRIINLEDSKTTLPNGIRMINNNIIIGHFWINVFSETKPISLDKYLIPDVVYFDQFFKTKINGELKAREFLFAKYYVKLNEGRPEKYWLLKNGARTINL